MSPIRPARVVTEEVHRGGVTISAGESVLASPAAANRDEAVFDSPNTLDITRKASGHLAFGHGLHDCLGAPLARLIVRSAWTRWSGAGPVCSWPPRRNSRPTTTPTGHAHS